MLPDLPAAQACGVRTQIGAAGLVLIMVQACVAEGLVPYPEQGGPESGKQDLASNDSPTGQETLFAEDEGWFASFGSSRERLFSDHGLTVRKGEAVEATFRIEPNDSGEHEVLEGTLTLDLTVRDEEPRSIVWQLAENNFIADKDERDAAKMESELYNKLKFASGSMLRHYRGDLRLVGSEAEDVAYFESLRRSDPEAYAAVADAFLEVWTEAAGPYSFYRWPRRECTWDAMFSGDHSKWVFAGAVVVFVAVGLTMGVWAASAMTVSTAATLLGKLAEYWFWYHSALSTALLSSVATVAFGLPISGLIVHADTCATDSDYGTTYP